MAETGIPATTPVQTEPRLPAVPRLQVLISLTLLVIGTVIFVIGAKPEWFALDRSPVIGFVQLTVFLIGLGVIASAAFVGFNALWAGKEKSIPADIGMRLVATGYVIALFSGMADVFGLGSQPLPKVPFFGPWQAMGVMIGQAVMVVGLLMYVPYHRHLQSH